MSLWDRLNTQGENSMPIANVAREHRTATPAQVRLVGYGGVGAKSLARAFS